MSVSEVVKGLPIVRFRLIPKLSVGLSVGLRSAGNRLLDIVRIAIDDLLA
jgi:hypothetical protein